MCADAPSACSWSKAQKLFLTRPLRVLGGNFADAIAEVAAHGRVIVLGSGQAIEAANAERPGLLSVTRVM